MNGNKPLIERIEEITLSEQDKDLYFTGPFIVMDKRNGNGRVYTSKLTIPIVEDHIERFVNKNKSVGELDHPDDPEEVGRIHMANITHRNVSLEREANVYHGRALIADTPQGILVKGLHRAGICIGASSRATGKTDKNNFVLPGMKLITPADLVLNPSAVEAVLDGIYESEQWVKPVFDEPVRENVRELLRSRRNWLTVNKTILTRLHDRGSHESKH